ncbi:MAG: sigma-54 dependent transcriptional regulator, partial [Chthoniobacterales bacterium]
MMRAENRRVLIVDDERTILLTLEALLSRHGYQPQTAATAAYGFRVLKETAPALVLLDLQLPDGEGLEMLDQIKRDHPETQVIILTAHDSLSNAIESIKRGAYHFISKPYAPEELLSLVEKALEKQSLLRETEALREKTQDLEKRLVLAETRLAPVFKSKVMQEIHELIRAMAPSDANVLITGESGVGKEVIANEIHRHSQRAQQTMVKLNCAAFPQAMIESELFGYVKGAFTGATHDFPGMIAAASGSTLFLDEISEMPADLQTRFLRVLQEREYRPLGSTKTLKADFRVVAATNRPISQALEQNRLRSDLYYRLNTFQIEIPALRERREDIPPLVTLFLKRFAQHLGKTEPEIAPEAFQKLLAYGWPGNVRELQNTMEYAVVLARKNRITVKELPSEVQLPVALQKPERQAP